MRELLCSLGGVALFALPGFAFAGLFPGLRAVPWMRRLGYGYLLGLVTVAGSLYALSAVLDVPLRRPAILATAAAITALGLFGTWRGRRERHRRTARLPLPGLVLALVGAGVSAGVFADALVFPLRDWDGRMHWSAQARYIRDEGSVLPLAIVRGQWFINHPRYPVLMPVAQVAVLEATGAGEDELFFRSLYAALLPAFLLVLYDGARRWAGWLPAGLATTAAAAVPFITFFPDGGATSSYSDLPLGCFYGAALVLLLRGRVLPSDGIAAGLLLGGAVLTKNEGTILAAFALLISALGPAVRLWRERKGRKLPPASRRRLLLKGARLCAAASAMVAVLAFFVWWRYQIPNRQDENYEEFVTAGHFFPDVITRIPEFGGPLLKQTFLTWDRWMGFWWVALPLLLVGWGVFRGRRSALSWPLLLGFAAPLALAWGAYTVHWAPGYLVTVTWERFLVQAAVPFFVLLALALREALCRSPLSWRGYSNRSKQQLRQGAPVCQDRRNPTRGTGHA
ncbi:MAG TPA: hypothetical protein VFR31_21460 [Thermoanaerobaculia bacterium]|nr:hypothetical protein [Thermoanaerobaculia bacterium]